eukprot:gene4205-5738_t
MPSTRRDFLKTTLAASATTAALAAGVKATAAEKPTMASARDYYELRAYRLKPGASAALLDAYLEKALLPALNARGLGPAFRALRIPLSGALPGRRRIARDHP